MSLDVAYAHIEKVEANRRTIADATGPGAQIVMDYLAYGWSVDEMCRRHPLLNLAEAHAAMAYISITAMKSTARSKQK